MIEDLGYTGHRLGYYAGGLAAAFCGAQFSSSVLWGMISDRYGRKIAIVTGTVGTAIGMLVFGSATTYTQAILGRVLGGFLCGNLGVMKSFLTEITDDSNRGKGFAMVSVSWAVGCLLAPLLGGMLSKPHEKYPAVFTRHSLFAAYPYLLPCMVCVFVNLVSALCCAIFMKETRRTSKKSTPPSSAKVKASRSKGDYAALALEGDDLDQSRHNVNGAVEMTQITTTKSPFEVGDLSDEDEDKENNGNVLDVERGAVEEVSSSSKSLLPHDSSHGLNGNDVQTTAIEMTEPDDDLEEGEEICCQKWCPMSSTASPTSQALRQRIVVLATSNYGVLAMGYILLDETIPLFLKLDRSMGGFSFNSSQIGLLLSVSGAAMIGFTSYILPMLASKSKKWLFETGLIGAIPITFLWPLLAIFNSQVLLSIEQKSTYYMILWPLLVATCVLKNIFATLSFTAVMIQVNHSVTEDYLGAVNGLGQSMAALARAIGPAFGGFLWSQSIQYNFVFLNFIGVASIISVCGFLNRSLPDSIDFKKVDRRKQNVDDEDGDEGDAGGGGMPMMH